MDKNILKIIVDESKRLVPGIFTKKQIKIIERYSKKERLSNTEKTYFYATIKKKIDLLSMFKGEFYFYGKDMIQERVEEAKDILDEIDDNAFISGTFLFSKNFNDVDIYVIAKRRKQYHQGKKHFIFITKEDLKKPIFVSAAKYCISNFFMDLSKVEIKRPDFNDLVMTYELAINEILDNDDQKRIRDLIFEHRIQLNKQVLDSYSLNKKFNEIKKLKKGEKIKYVNNLAKELLLRSYSNDYVYNEISPFVTRLKKDADGYKSNENLLIYIDMLNEVKHESRKAKT